MENERIPLQGENMPDMDFHRKEALRLKEQASKNLLDAQSRLSLAGTFLGQYTNSEDSSTLSGVIETVNNLLNKVYDANPTDEMILKHLAREQKRLDRNFGKDTKQA